MTSSNGWLKISRRLQEHWIWQDPKRLKWWLDLLMMAAWRDTETYHDTHKICLKRGQIIASIASLSERWDIDRKVVIKFLKNLEDEDMLIREVVHRQTPIITICNYERYQVATDDDRDTQRDIIRDTQRDGQTEKEIKQEKENIPHTPYKEKEINKEKESEEEFVVVDARTHVRDGETLDLRPYQARLEAIAMSCHIIPQELEYWIQEFNVHLEAVGETYDDANQYLLRLKNWINKRQEIKRHATSHHSTTREQRYASGSNLINGLLAYAHNNKSGSADVSDEVFPF